MLECPDELRGLKAIDIDPVYLYSYWLTIYFIVYAVLYLALQQMSAGKQIGWLSNFNPYTTIIISSVVQLLFFVIGARVMPIYFIAGVATWKLVLILATIVILPVDWSPVTICCNLAVLGLYFLYMFWVHRINPIDLYACIETNPDYYPPTASEFMRTRFGYRPY